MVQYNVVVVYAFSIHFNRFYRAILVENSEISNDYKTWQDSVIHELMGPVCMDHAILHGKPFSNPLILIWVL